MSKTQEHASRTCAVCQLPATQCCSSCRNTFYCNREHQKQHWKVHKTLCTPYKIETDEVFGKRMIASRDIKPGEVILRENPLIICPWLKSSCVCLGCHEKITEETPRICCTNCKLPMCNPKCEKLPYHIAECKFIQKKSCSFENNDKRNLNTIISLLRTLLLREKDAAKYNTILKLDYNSEQWRKTLLYKEIKNSTLEVITSVFKLEFDEDAIMQLAGIIETKSFEIKGVSKPIMVNGLYSLASGITHNCVPNSRCTFHGSDLTLVVLANVLINKGDVITISRTNTFWDTLTRQKYLQMNMCLKCSCDRCTDPTELETYLSAIICSKCKNKESRIISKNPLDLSAEWKCNNCSHTIPAKQISWGNDSLRREIDVTGTNNVKYLETFLDTYSRTLHSKNVHMLHVKNLLIQIYGNMEGYQLTDLPEHVIEKKIDYCHELLEVIDIVEPGMSRIRGLVLYELQSAMVMQAKRDLESEAITKSAAQDIMNQAMVLLKASAEILRTEEDVSAQLQQKLMNLAQDLEID